MNNSVQAISFDLWGTLIKSNPKYKPLRIKALINFIRIKKLRQLRTEDVEATFRTFEKSLDCYSQATGRQVPIAESYKTLLLLFDIPDTEDNVIELRSSFSELTREYPPMVLDGVADVLFSIHDLGLPMVLCSNTNLISGATLKRTFKDNDIALLQLFNGNTIFSDDFGYAKPSKRIFEAAFNTTNVAYENILHVGDNEMTDGACTKLGAKFLFVNHDDALMKIGELTNYLKKIGCTLPLETGHSLGI